MKILLLLFSISIFSMSNYEYDEKILILKEINTLNELYEKDKLSKEEYQEKLKILLNKYDTK